MLSYNDYNLIVIMDRTAQFYSQPSYVGGALSVYAGSRRQRGGSVLGSLKSFFMPLLSKLAKRGAKSAMKVAQNVVGDVIAGKNIKSSISQHGLNAAKRLGSEMLSTAIGTSISSGKRKLPNKAKQTRLKRRKNF